MRLKPVRLMFSQSNPFVYYKIKQFAFLRLTI